MAPPAQVTVSITTTSEPMSDPNNLPPAQTPTITLNGQPVPPPDEVAYMPCGYQVVVLDASQDLTNPASIVSNRWQFLGGNLTGDWGVSYRWMYDDIANQLLASGDPDQQVVLVASFGMDAMAMPTPATVEQLIGRGAGTQLQQWLWVQTLSEGGGFIYYPCNYVLIGASGLPYAGGSEAFSFSGESDPIETTVTATLDNPTPPPSG